MKSINLKSISLRYLQFFITACLCTFVFLTSTFPAAASVSQPSDGVVSLDEIQARTEEVAKSQPCSLKELHSDVEGGLNAVQGKADYNKMNRPDNSQDATTVEEKIIKGFDSLTSESN